MKILSNTTSPFARVARIALIEKGYDPGGLRMMNPWTDDAEMLRLNPASKVPTLELPSGLPLTESLLVPAVAGTGAAGAFLARRRRRPCRVPGRPCHGRDRRHGQPRHRDACRWTRTYEESRVGLKRRRTVVEGLRALDADPPPFAGGVPDIAVLTAVVAVDYLPLRFPDHPWVEPVPRLQALRDAVSDRPSFRSTQPYI